MEIILLLLACFGLTLVLVHGIIFDTLKIRPLWEKSKFLKELFECSMCTGFWVGLYFSFVMSIYCILPSFGVNLLVNKILFYILTIPFASSGVCWFLERISILADDVINKMK